jgi:hypothetical protein
LERLSTIDLLTKIVCLVKRRKDFFGIKSERKGVFCTDPSSSLRGSWVR